MGDSENLEKGKTDDTLFIYKHDKKGILVFGLSDAKKYKYKLKDKGYKHISTKSGAEFLESVLNKTSIHSVWYSIYNLKNPDKD